MHVETSESLHHSHTFCYFSEFGFGIWPLVSVRMVLQGQLVEGFLDLTLGGIFGNPQDVVVVPLCQDELRDQQHMNRQQQHRLNRGHTAGFWHLRAAKRSRLSARSTTPDAPSTLPRQLL